MHKGHRQKNLTMRGNTCNRHPASKILGPSSRGIYMLIPSFQHQIDPNQAQEETEISFVYVLFLHGKTLRVYLTASYVSIGFCQKKIRFEDDAYNYYSDNFVRATNEHRCIQCRQLVDIANPCPQQHSYLPMIHANAGIYHGPH
jgi:hypothetical protein